MEWYQDPEVKVGRGGSGLSKGSDIMFSTLKRVTKGLSRIQPLGKTVSAAPSLSIPLVDITAKQFPVSMYFIISK